jgi:hypothetical protein
MRVLRTAYLSSILLLSLAAPSVADPMPRGAKPAQPQKIAQAYAGRTDIWEEGCNGGIYFSPNWQARAWCAESSDNVGAGSWRVDESGRLCQSLNWYWPNGTRAGVSAGEELCISHVVDRWGKMWRNWPGDAEWWPMERLPKGYKFQSDVQQARARLGI